MSSSAKPSLTVGVLLAIPVQLLDVAAVDLFGMLTHGYLKYYSLPGSIEDLAVDVSISYIGVPGEDSRATCSSSAYVSTSNTIDDAAVAPGKLDVLMLPGGPPALHATQDVLDFVSKHCEAGATILSICTGAFIAGRSGILKGKRATGPLPYLSDIIHEFHETEWDWTRRFVQDGNIWTSGAITNGMDMTAAYIKTLYPGPLSSAVCELADVGDRGETYPQSNAFAVLLKLRSGISGN